VRADGTILDMDRSQDRLHAAAVSIGLLGIISTITFRCVPAFLLRSRSSVLKAQEVVDGFEDINRRNLYTDMLYFPVTDEVEILAVSGVEHDEVATSQHRERQVSRDHRENEALTMLQASRTGPLPRRVQTRFSRERTIVGLKLLAWLLRRSTAVQRFGTRFLVGSVYRPRVGRSDWVLAYDDHGGSGRSPGLLQDMEIAIPYGQARAAITVLRNHFARTQKYPLLPVHIRCSARSDSWLSPAHDRDVCWLEFWQYPRSDRFFTEVHQLLKPFRYRFHWGKETRAEREYISQQYDRWADFVRLREEWDPKGTFLNEYLASFFCARDSTSDGPVG